jgi:ABC-type oligopeptide transport system substrate-binding subunit
MEQILAADAPVIPLVYPNQGWLVHRAVRGFATLDFGAPDFTGVHFAPD